MSNNTMPNSAKKAAGVMAFFDGPAATLEAMKKLRAENYECFDSFSPFPIHGMDEAQGLKRSPLPYITFLAGITGTACAFALEYWTSAIDWPINVGGKPMNSWPAFVPVMFELTVLFGGLCTVGGMFFLNRLPNITKKAFDPGITRDRFALVVEAPEIDEHADEEDLAKHARFKKFDEREVSEFFKRVGAREVKSVYSEKWS